MQGGLSENIVGRVEVDCGLVLVKSEGFFFENFAEREGWTAGFISRKVEGLDLDRPPGRSDGWEM